jgi:hypothetical protein
MKKTTTGVETFSPGRMQINLLSYVDMLVFPDNHRSSSVEMMVDHPEGWKIRDCCSHQKHQNWILGGARSLGFYWESPEFL